MASIIEVKKTAVYKTSNALNYLFLVLIIFPMLLRAQETKTIQQLFDQLKLQPVSKSDEIKVKQAIAFKNIAKSQLYPNIDIFGKYDYASIPTAMYPLPPNEMLPMVQDQTMGQPFSRNIYRVGSSISMPLFVKSIFTIAAQAQMMVHSFEDQQFINLLKNEAIIVSANASFIYIQQLDSALEKKKSSLLKTKEFVDIKVKNGRSPGSAAININNAINEIDILENELALQREDVIASIASLTGITITSAVPMMQVGPYKDGQIKALDPLRKKIEAEKLTLKAEKEKLLPSLFLQGSYSEIFAKAYNNHNSISNDYTVFGLTLKVPLFSKNQYAQINKSKVDIEASQNDLDKLTMELTTQAKQLENQLGLLENSIELYNKSIKDKEELLDIARVSYSLDQMTMEDYLKYEDDVVMEKTRLYKTNSQTWQTLMKLAVIYGNDIQTLVK